MYRIVLILVLYKNTDRVDSKLLAKSGAIISYVFSLNGNDARQRHLVVLDSFNFWLVKDVPPTLNVSATLRINEVMHLTSMQSCFILKACHEERNNELKSIYIKLS